MEGSNPIEEPIERQSIRRETNIPIKRESNNEATD
jgi:hypothetical protein